MRRTLALALVASLALLVWLLRSDPDRRAGDRSLPRALPSAKPRSEVARDSLQCPVEAPLASVEEAGPPPSTAPPGSVATAPAVRDAPCGRVVDERTGEGVPEVLVRVAWGAAQGSDITDREGRFEVAAPAAGSGACSIEIWDGGVALASLERDPQMDPPPWDLPVAIGPTYPLVLLDAARGAQRARLVESTRDEDVAGELAVLPGEIARAPEDAGDDRTWSWLPVRPGPAPWIRYPRMEHEPDDGLRKRIEAVEANGRFHRGTTRGAVGIQSEVALHFIEARMSIAGRVLDGQDEPIAGASVLLAPEHSASEGARRRSVWHETRSGPEGSFAFDDVPRERWNLFAWTVGEEGEELGLFGRARVPEGGPVQREDLRLRARSSFVLEGALPRGIPDLDRWMLVLHIAECAPFGHGWLLRLGGGTPWPSLPGGVSPLRSCWLGEPSWASTDADGVQGETFPIRRERLTLQIVDGPTGAPLEDAEVLLGPGGEILTRAGGAASWLLPPEIELEWMVARAGHASSFGDENSFTTAEGTRVARATLWPGWGAALYFRAGPRLEGETGPEADRVSARTSDVLGALAAPPIPGVEVLADGVEAGTSDGEGAVRLALDRDPFRLTLVRRHWRLTGLDRLTVPGSSALRYVVWLEPDLR